MVTVLDRYGHLFPGAEARVNDALDALASKAGLTSEAAIVPLPG